MPNVLELEGFVETKQALDRMLLDDPKLVSKIRKDVRTVIDQARAKISASIPSAVPNDPHQDFRAVRRSVYKQIFGGQVNILQSKRAGALAPIVVTHKLDQNPHQRGGNRHKPSARTIALQSYQGKDRGFILRFLNSGTSARVTQYGNRAVGSIAARNFFVPTASQTMQQAAEQLSELIDQEIISNFENK